MQITSVLVFWPKKINNLARINFWHGLAYSMSVNNGRNMEKIVTEHIGLARALAVKFYNRRKNMGLELDEFISAAMLGLCEAARLYRPEQNNKFAPYAFFRIRGAMYDLVRSSGSIPRSMFCEISSLQQEGGKVKYRMAKDLSELTSLQTIIEEYGLKLVFGSDEMPEITYSRMLNPEEATARSEATHYIRNLVSNLPAERKQVLSHYYYEEKTYREIEPLIEGSSKSWICRLHKSALTSLRNTIEANSMRWDLQRAFGG